MHQPGPSILRTELCGVPLAAPVLLAAGTAGTLDEMGEVLDLRRVGAVVTKSITRLPRAGNPEPRITWARAGMLNAIGLANPGAEAFAETLATGAAERMGCPVVLSIAGFSVPDYAEVAGLLAGPDAPGRGVAAVELNVSCPNVHGGTEFGADPVALREVVSAVRERIGSMPVLVKLGPVTIGTPACAWDLAQAAHEAGADAITLCNTIPAMGIDVTTRRPVLANVTGGLSGPAIHPVVLRLVHEVSRRFARDAGVPIVAAGGVTRWQDAAAYILAGATGMQIGAGSFADPRAAIKVARGLERWARTQGVRSIEELVGALEIG